jgi:hypothetical protein
LIIEIYNSIPLLYDNIPIFVNLSKVNKQYYFIYKNVYEKKIKQLRENLIYVFHILNIKWNLDFKLNTRQTNNIPLFSRQLYKPLMDLI